MGGLRTPVSLTTRTDENSVLDGTAAPTAIGMIHGSVNRTYLSTLEKGASYPGLEIIAKLATVLGGRAAEFRGCQPSVRKMQPRSCAATSSIAYVAHRYTRGGTRRCIPTAEL